MSLPSKDLVLPRPGATPTPSTPQIIPGPTEASFTATFGALLPPAKYLHTPSGEAAYYDLTPSLPISPRKKPHRVLLVHGVQTPAIGLLPLVRALRPSFPLTHFVLLDLWGHGLSDTPVTPHVPDLFHGLIDDLLDELSWPTVNLVGYSFGGILTVGYAASRPQRVQSYVIVAPAGLIQSSRFSEEQRGYLRGGGDEVAARKWIIDDFLEDGGLVVPTDWEERVRRGEVVAEKVREWSMQNHAGHAASVVAVVRDGGPFDSDAVFVKAVGTRIPALAVLGREDEVVSEEQLRKVGFEDVRVVEGVGHRVVRQSAPEVAGFIGEFWKKLEKNASQSDGDNS